MSFFSSAVLKSISFKTKSPCLQESACLIWSFTLLHYGLSLSVLKFSAGLWPLHLSWWSQRHLTNGVQGRRGCRGWSSSTQEPIGMKDHVSKTALQNPLRPKAFHCRSTSTDVSSNVWELWDKPGSDPRTLGPIWVHVDTFQIYF